VAIISTALILSPSIPGQLHPLLAATYFSLANAMACRVFRAVILGIITDPKLNAVRTASFYRATNDGQLDRDDSTRSKRAILCRSPKLEINIAVETDTTVDSNDRYVVWGRKLAGDDAQQDASHQA
jgi:hypothetical protein